MRIMAEAVMNPVQVNGTVVMSTGPTPSPSFANSSRISAVVDRLYLHVRRGSRNDNKEIFHLCLSLSSGIDCAVADNERPVRAPDLPHLLKQVCQWRNHIQLQAAIMVLMLSIKGACRNGWFGEKENEELHSLSDEIASSFCSVRDMNRMESTFHHGISAVMSRFYPRMKMCEILSFVEAMPGYGAFVKDFHITKHSISSSKTYLFVARTDNIETSSCIISPRLVNFLINGKAVDRRTCVHKDPGPQTPTELTQMLKNGTNLLQVLGQFDGKYIIAVAFMSMISNPSCPALLDYVPQAATAPDNDLIEGPSRISLNCPISFKRIKTPVKGQLCKHIQCFDFENYVDMNSRRPSWRCPHCSQSVSFDDIRIDQRMLKVLKEVGVNVSFVKFSADGSWEAVDEGDLMDKPRDKPTLHQEYMTSQDKGAYILDLTEGDNDMNASNSHQDSDRKPSAQLQDQPNVNHQISSYANINSRVWRHATGTSNSRSNVTMSAPLTDTVVTVSQDQSQFLTSNNMQLVTRAMGTSHDRSNVTMEPVTDSNLNAISQGQSHIFASNNVQFQQFNTNNTNEYGRHPTPATHVTSIPVAVQALPSQTPAGMVSGNRQQQHTTLNISRQQMMHLISTSQHMGLQNWVRHDHPHISSQTVLQFGDRLGPPPQSSGYWHSSSYPLNHFNSPQHQSLNQMVSNPAPLSPQVHQGVAGLTTGLGNNQQSHQYHMAAVQQANQIRCRTPYVSAPVQTSVSSMPVASLEEQRDQRQSQGSRVLDAPADQNWQPTGRMRGSLSGRAYSDALNDLIILPTQPVQAANPPVLNTPRPLTAHHLQALVANNRSAHGDGGRLLPGG